jgi:ABC-type transport system involved in multi-copper enzyme maturation permease subunit
MKSIFLFELKKIFGLKKTVVCAGIVVLLLCGTFFGRAIANRLFENLPDIKDMLTYASGEVTSDRFAEDERRFQELVNNPDSFPAGGESTNSEYEGIFDGGSTHQEELEILESVLFIKNINESPQIQISDLERELFYPATSQERALLIQKNIDMLSQKGNLVIGYNLFYDYYNNFLMNLFPYIIGFLIIFFVAPVFAGEYSTKMDSLILSSKRGKRGVIAAKFFSSILAVTLIYIFVMGFYILLCGSILGFSGGESSFVTMYYDIFQYIVSPYSFTMLQFLLTSLAISCAACIGFTIFALLVSAKSRNILAVSAVCLIVFHAPLLMTTFNASFPPIVNVIYGRMAQAISILDSFNGFVVLGNVIMLKEISFLFMAVTSVLFGLWAWRSFKRRQAVN